MRKVFDVFLGVPKRDWNAEALERVLKSKEARRLAGQKVEQERAPDTNPSLALSGYAGTYSAEMYGEATVVEEGGKLVLRLEPAPAFVGDAEMILRASSSFVRVTELSRKYKTCIHMNSHGVF